jgi:cell division protease FtsH
MSAKKGHGKSTGWIKKTRRFLVRQWRADKLRFGTFAFLAFLGASAMGSYVGQQLTESAQYRQLAQLPTETLNAFNQQLETGKVKAIVSHVANDGSMMSPHLSRFVEIDLKDGSRKIIRSELLDNEAAKKALYDQALRQNIEFKQGLRAGDTSNRLMDFVFFILYIASFVAIMLVIQRAASDFLVGKNFNPKAVNEDINFDDIVGYEEVKREFRETIQQLKKAKSFAQQGIKAPKGILLTGSPGVGKTMFAKALANECQANFLYATGADFAELYVGVGARRARSLFATARQNSPSVIFIDEIDALGARDSFGMDSERLATINQLLAEMDGFSENGEVLVIGATNHPDKLDPAMRRPGRFDKIINIPLPNAEAREGILARSLTGVALDSAIDLRALALRSTGFSGAQLKNWAAEAKNLALRESDGKSLRIDQGVMERAQEIILMGYSQTKPTKKEEELVAFHELGHALVSKRLCPNVIVDKVAAAGRGAALGFTFHRPLEEQNLASETEMLGEIASLLGGRAAEEIFMRDVSSGSANDLERANALAQHMVCTLGFGASNPLMTFKQNAIGGTQMPESMRQDIQKILREQYGRAKAVIQADEAWMRTTKERLVERGMLGEEELFGDLPRRDAPQLAQAA